MLHFNDQVEPGKAGHESSAIIGENGAATARNCVESHTKPTEAGQESSLAATEAPFKASFLHNAQATSAAAETSAAMAIPGTSQEHSLAATLPGPGHESGLPHSNGMPSVDDTGKLAAAAVQPNVAVAPIMKPLTPVDVHNVQPKQRVMCLVTGRSFHFGCLPPDEQMHLCGCGPPRNSSMPGHDEIAQPGVALNAQPISNRAELAMPRGRSSAKEKESSLDQPSSARNGSHQAKTSTQNMSLILLATKPECLDVDTEHANGAAAQETAQGARNCSEPWAESAAAGAVGKGVASIAASGLQPCTLSLGQRAPWGPLRWQLIRGAAVAHPEVVAEIILRTLHLHMRMPDTGLMAKTYLQLNLLRCRFCRGARSRCHTYPM